MPPACGSPSPSSSACTRHTGGLWVTGAPRALISSTVAIAAVLLAVVCGASPRVVAVPTVAAARTEAPADTGVTVAQNVGPTLIVLSLDPAEPGDNTVGVELRDIGGASVAGAVRVDLALDGVAAGSVQLQGNDRRGRLAVAHRGHADLRIRVLDGASAGAIVTFGMDLPATRVPEGTLAAIDRTMQGLHTLRETQTLGGTGPPVTYHFEYEAPDRVRYTNAGENNVPHETRLVGRDRFDRDGSGPWSRSDLGLPSNVPSSALARTATRVRLIGRDHDATQDLLELAFVHGAAMHYRIWVGADDHLVRRYTMLAPGHFMTGTYYDLDGPLGISPP